MATKLAKIVADFRTSLATKIAVGGTTATLQSATDDDGVSLPAGQYFFTLDGDNPQKEHIVCTLSGTSLSSIKSITRQGVQSSGAVREHRIGSSVTITNFAHIKYINDLLDGTTNLNASLPLEYDATASITTANQLATKDYVDGVAIAGGADASTTVKGISKLSTAPASATEPIAVGTNDTRIPTQDENNALAGTSGTPSTSNKFVTNDDTATTGASKVLRTKADSLLDDANLALTTAGDVVYSDGTDLIRLGIGTAGQVLQTNSGATAPEWTTKLTPKTGQDSRTDASGTGTQTITHSLGAIPSYIQIFANAETSDDATAATCTSFGTATSTSTETATWMAVRAGSEEVAGQDATHVISLNNGAGTAVATATITSITTTTFVLTWDVNDTGGKTRYFQWTVFP